MKSEARKIRFKKWWLLPVSALLTFILTEILSANPAFVEKYYSRKLYPFMAEIFSQISVLLPFSLDDIFYIFLISTGFILLILVTLRRISFKTAGKVVVNVLAVVYILFYFLWGFNYYRPKLEKRLGLDEQNPRHGEFVRVFKDVIEDCNESYAVYNQSDLVNVDSMVEQSYRNLADVLRINYPGGLRKAKNITFSRFFAQAGISGYYGPFFNEVHVNSNNLPVEYPFVLAHEKAHQFGITSEAEANFYAWLVCTESSSKQLQYSGKPGGAAVFYIRRVPTGAIPENHRETGRNGERRPEKNPGALDEIAK